MPHLILSSFTPPPSPHSLEYKLSLPRALWVELCVHCNSLKLAVGSQAVVLVLRGLMFILSWSQQQAFNIVCKSESVAAKTRSLQTCPSTLHQLVFSFSFVQHNLLIHMGLNTHSCMHICACICISTQAHTPSFFI